MQIRRELLESCFLRALEWEENFREFVEDVCRSGLVKELYLVGSRARGDNRLASDFDVVAVVTGDVDILEVLEKIRKLRKRQFPLDLIVIREDEVQDPLYKEMLRDTRRLC